MSYNISAATFIRDTIRGAFCLFESMASLLPLVDDMTVIDLGSTDGTLEILRNIAECNPKIRLINSNFTKIDAGAFADAANECVNSWKHDVGIFWQADEIWHQELLEMFSDKLAAGKESMAFWRYQLRENFQIMKWFPHPVHRLGKRGTDFQFVGDGMNSTNVFGNDVCSYYNMGWFTKWGTMDPLDIPVEEMILDVSLVGAFRDNIPARRELHAPMWHEPPSIEGIPAGQWYSEALQNDNWIKQETPFDIPKIMRWHLGRVKYDVRPELIQALKDNSTEALVGL